MTLQKGPGYIIQSKWGTNGAKLCFEEKLMEAADTGPGLQVASGLAPGC
jgi:hypothetical protein